MKKIFLGFFLMAAGILAINLSSQAADEPLTGRQIMVMVEERPDGDDRKAVMTVELINRRKRKRVRTILSYVDLGTPFSFPVSP